MAQSNNALALAQLVVQSRPARPDPAKLPLAHNNLPRPVLELIDCFLQELNSANPSQDDQVLVVRGLKVCLEQKHDRHAAVIAALVPVVAHSQIKLKLHASTALSHCCATAPSSIIQERLSTIVTTLARLVESSSSTQNLASLPNSSLRLLATTFRTLDVVLAKSSHIPPHVVSVAVSAITAAIYGKDARTLSTQTGRRGRPSSVASFSGVMGSFAPPDLPRRAPTLSRSSSISSFVGSESEDDDGGAKKRIDATRVQVEALKALRSLAKADPKLLHGHWTTFFADSRFDMSGRNLEALLASSEEGALRQAACSALSAMLHSSASYLLIADDRPAKASFTPLSHRLGGIVTQLHDFLAAQLLRPVDADLRHQLLDAVAELSANTPYSKLQPSLAAGLSSSLASCCLGPDHATMAHAFQAVAALLERLPPATAATLPQSADIVKSALSAATDSAETDVRSGAWRALASSIGLLDLTMLQNASAIVGHRASVALEERKAILSFVAALLRSDANAVISLCQAQQTSKNLLPFIRSALDNPELLVDFFNIVALPRASTLDGFWAALEPVRRCLELEVEPSRPELDAASCRALGFLVKLPVSEATTSLEAVIEHLGARLSGVDPVLSSASWAFANCCDILSSQPRHAKAAVAFVPQLISLGDSAHEKSHPSAFRALGSLLRSGQVEQPSPAVACLLQGLKSHSPKTTWNAAASLGSALAGLSDVQLIITALSIVMVDSKVFKVRLQAVDGLSKAASLRRLDGKGEREVVIARVKEAEAKVENEVRTVSKKELPHLRQLEAKLASLLAELSSGQVV